MNDTGDLYPVTVWEQTSVNRDINIRSVEAPAAH